MNFVGWKIFFLQPGGRGAAQTALRAVSAAFGRSGGFAAGGCARACPLQSFVNLIADDIELGLLGGLGHQLLRNGHFSLDGLHGGYGGLGLGMAGVNTVQQSS